MCSLLNQEKKKKNCETKLLKPNNPEVPKPAAHLLAVTGWLPSKHAKIKWYSQSGIKKVVLYT